MPFWTTPWNIPVMGVTRLGDSPGVCILPGKMSPNEIKLPANTLIQSGIEMWLLAYGSASNTNISSVLFFFEYTKFQIK